MSKAMSSNRPYLIRAFFDWIVDNDCTPYVVVDAYFDGVEVPQSYVSKGQIVLNIAPRAVTGFHLDNKEIFFNTRFGGMPTDIRIPVEAVLGIYARENGQGMIFQPEEPREPDPEPGKEENSANKKSGEDRPKPDGRPKLRVIK